MKRVWAVVGCAGLLLVSGATVASAAPAPNEHNCAGVVVSQLAGPDFGPAVSTAAQEQVVDNFGLADCGQTNRGNP
jgi:hypothetical protein